jgi:hypothetical protein
MALPYITCCLQGGGQGRVPCTTYNTHHKETVYGQACNPHNSHVLILFQSDGGLSQELGKRFPTRRTILTACANFLSNARTGF